MRRVDAQQRADEQFDEALRLERRGQRRGRGVAVPAALGLAGDVGVGEDLRRRDDRGQGNRGEEAQAEARAHSEYRTRDGRGHDRHRLPCQRHQSEREAQLRRRAALRRQKRERHQGDGRDQAVERHRRHRHPAQHPQPRGERRARQRAHRDPSQREVDEKVQVESNVRGEDQIEKVVGIERQRVGVAGQRLAAAVERVPPRDLAGAERRRRNDFDRVVGGEVVAMKKEAEGGEQKAEGCHHDRHCEPPHRPLIIK